MNQGFWQTKTTLKVFIQKIEKKITLKHEFGSRNKTTTQMSVSLLALARSLEKHYKKREYKRRETKHSNIYENMSQGCLYIG